MKINCKLILAAIIICNINTNVFSEYPSISSQNVFSQNDLLNIITNMNSTEYTNVSNILPSIVEQAEIAQKSDANKKKVATVKTRIDKEHPEYNNEQLDFLIMQLYNRFSEKVEYRNLQANDNENSKEIIDKDKIYGEPVNEIKEEILRLGKKDKLTKSNLGKLSMGLIRFIAEGSLTYNEITPDIALEYYNNKTNDKLDIETVKDLREHDNNEIYVREKLQDMREKFYNAVINMNNFMKDSNQYKGDVTFLLVLDYINKKLDPSNIVNSINNVIKAMGKNENVYDLDVETIFNKIIENDENKALPEDENKALSEKENTSEKNVIKRMAESVRNWFKRLVGQDKSQSTGEQSQVEVQNVNDNESDDNLLQDEITNIVVENSNLLEIN